MNARALLDRMQARLPNYDHDYDGRPPVEYDGYDPLLAALIRAHPDRIPVELVDQLATSRGRVSILASALD